MKDLLEILIRQDGLSISSSFKKETEFIAMPEASIGNRLLQYCSGKNIAGISVALYLAEDFLFFKKITLPLQTADLKEAIRYQLAMFAPFAGKAFSTYTAVRGKGHYDICIYAASEENVASLLKELVTHGFKLSGLYPESQRYVTRLGKSKEWGLLLPDRFPKLFLFNKQKVIDRLLCHTEPSVDELVTLKAGKSVYRPDWVENSGYLDANVLLKEKPILKDFNLLPEAFRRPDYMRYTLLVLCILNLVAFLLTGAVKEYRVWTELKMVEAKIEKLRPTVKEVEQLRIEAKKLNGIIGQIEDVGKNIDIISLLEKLTKTVPENSYLDQLRMDDKTGDIELQGYTDDVGILTSKLDALGNAKLKATSRRKNQTYFNVEISRQ